MKTKQTILFGVLALIGGIIGGILSDKLPGDAVAKSDVEKVVSAEKFELVDGEGMVKAYLTTVGGMTVFYIGEDPHENYFKVTRTESGVEQQIATSFSNNILLASYDNRARVEISGKTLPDEKQPVLPMKVHLGVDSKGDPSIQLYDDFYKPRLIIGKTELKQKNTGSTEIRSTGSIVVFDEDGKVVYSMP